MRGTITIDEQAGTYHVLSKFERAALVSIRTDGDFPGFAPGTAPVVVPRYQPHFATCPQAAAWRNR